MNRNSSNGMDKRVRILATIGFVFLMLVNVRIGLSDGRSDSLDILGLKLTVFTASAEASSTDGWKWAYCGNGVQCTIEGTNENGYAFKCDVWQATPGCVQDTYECRRSPD